MPRRGVNVHENEVMRAYKTVNDTYIEPISFTVPRRAETFQSDIYPPAIGTKPAVSAKDWLDGKAGLPPKIDLESVYEGNEPIEVASNKSAPAPAFTPAPAPIATSAPSKPATAPQLSPAVRSPPPTMADQKGSIAAMASRYQDNDPENEEDEDSDASSFEEVTREVVKGTGTAPSKADLVTPKSPVKAAPSAAAKRAVSPAKTTSASTSIPAASTSSDAQINKLMSLVESQTKLLIAQDSKLNRLMDEVDKLQKAQSALTSSQGEKIRQIELQLEAMDS